MLQKDIMSRYLKGCIKVVSPDLSLSLDITNRVDPGDEAPPNPGPAIQTSVT